MRVLIQDIPQYNNKTIEISGWVHRIRELGAVVFLIVRDRSAMAQIVCTELGDVKLESVITVRGIVSQNERAMGGYELQAESLEILSSPKEELPIAVNQDPGKLALDTVLDHRVVSLRTPQLQGAFRMASGVLKYFSAYLRSQGFVEIKTSKLVSTETEGGTGLFSVDYFDRKMYLAQSPQFYKQAMMATGLERVFECSPVYRAEKHESPRHMNEYISLDVEMGFISDENDLMDLQQEVFHAICDGIQKEHQSVLDAWGASVPTREQISATPRISHDEAKQIVKERSGKAVFEINPQAERVLCEWAEEEHNTDLVFVYNFPRRKRPFYTYPLGKGTRSFDLLFRGLEITTGGQRIHDYDELCESLRLSGLSEEALKDYLSIFKYSCPPHGGFAMGLERVVQKILGMQSVKEASAFPRDRRRIHP